MGRTVWAYLLLLAASTVAAQSDKQQNSNLLVAPLVFYTPETNLAFGPAMFLRFATSTDTGQHASYVRLFGYYTLNEQWYGRLEGEVWGTGNNWKLRGDVNYSIYPYLFFGIGNETPSANRERYSQDRIRSRVEISRRIKHARPWYAGIVGELYTSYNLVLPEGGILATQDVAGANGVQLYAAGWLANVDTRNHVYFPTQGWYTDVSLTGYLGDFRFAAWQWDLRTFVAIGRKSALAFQFYQHISAGTVPFQLMPQLGDENRYRGMVGGRFTDNNLQILQAGFPCRYQGNLYHGEQPVQ